MFTWRRILASLIVFAGGGCITEWVSSKLESCEFDSAYASLLGSIYLLWWTLLDRAFRDIGYSLWRVPAAGLLPAWVVISLLQGVTRLDWLAYYAQFAVGPAILLDGVAWVLARRPGPAGQDRKRVTAYGMLIWLWIFASLLFASWVIVYMVQAITSGVVPVGGMSGW